MKKINQKKYFGIVEGFFSSPREMWTKEERQIVLKFITKYCPNLNTYFYCPKDDLFVLKKWNELYPKKKFEAIKEAYFYCEKNNIDFVYGLNPDFDLKKVEENYPDYLKNIISKLNQLKKIGVNKFCILYDDIPFAYEVTEKAKKEADAKIGKLQAKVLNDILNKFENLDLWFCPPDYFFQEKTPYLKSLCQNLSNKISLLWTGDQIFTPTISDKLFKETIKNLNKDRKLIWWDNYPVNDCEHIDGTFNIGAFNNPEKNAFANLSGILINPMREPFANLSIFYTASLFYSNQNTFDREQSLKDFFVKFFGDNWKSFWIIYISFSDTNCVDSEPRGYLKEILQTNSIKNIQKILMLIKNDLSIIEGDDSENYFKNFFFEEVIVIIRRVNAYLIIFENIILGVDWVENFIEIDAFPVSQRKAFLTKIYKVLDARLNLLNVNKKLIKEYVIIKNIYYKYDGISRLKISKEDDLILLENLQILLSKERNIFIEQIKNTPLINQVKTLIQRYLINGY